jgi:hypothetical protein
MLVWGKPNIKRCTHSHCINLVKPSGMTTPKLQLCDYHLKEREMVSTCSLKKDTRKIRTYHVRSPDGKQLQERGCNEEMKVKQMLDIEGHCVALLHDIKLGGRGWEM